MRKINNEKNIWLFRKCTNFTFSDAKVNKRNQRRLFKITPLLETASYMEQIFSPNLKQFFWKELKWAYITIEMFFR